MAWYVLYTKPRNEKKVALLLDGKNVNAYCPVQEVMKQWSDRKKKVIEPVFKSYIFVELQNYATDNTKVLTTAGAVRFLWWQGKPGVVRDEEIEAIRNFLNEYKNVELNVSITEGQKVVVKEGLFKDKEGEVLQLRGKRAILHIHSLGWSISAVINVSSLLPST